MSEKVARDKNGLYYKKCPQCGAENKLMCDRQPLIEGIWTLKRKKGKEELFNHCNTCGHEWFDLE